jgi:hypothetical protein
MPFLRCLLQTNPLHVLDGNGADETALPLDDA